MDTPRYTFKLTEDVGTGRKKEDFVGTDVMLVYRNTTPTMISVIKSLARVNDVSIYIAFKNFVELQKCDEDEGDDKLKSMRDTLNARIEERDYLQQHSLLEEAMTDLDKLTNDIIGNQP